MQSRTQDEMEMNKMKLVASLSSRPTRSSFLKEVSQLPGGQNLLDCIQCGLCAGSCPTRFAMDYSPMQIIKMVHLGMRDDVLTSSTIWACSTCFTCYTRCPRAIDITTLMMSLKNLAMKEGSVAKKGMKPKFHESFFEVVNKYGRLHEPELMIKVIKKNDIRSLLHNGALAWRLLKSGKLQMQAPKIGQFNDISKILEMTAKEES